MAIRLGAMDGVLGAGDDAGNFERAQRLGLEGVEVDLKVAELKDSSSDRPERLRALARRQGLSIPSMVLGEHNKGGLATWFRDQEEVAEEVRLAIDWCRRVGASTLLVPFFFFNEPKGKTHRDAVADRLRPLCAVAEQAGVVLAFEGVLTAERLVEMADRIGSPAFGVYYDPANATWCDHDIAQEVRTLGKLIRQAHVKEAKVYTADAHPGEGRVDWAGFAAALGDIGYEGWYVLETPGGDEAAMAKDAAFARRTFSGK